MHGHICYTSGMKHSPIYIHAPISFSAATPSANGKPLPTQFAGTAYSGDLVNGEVVIDLATTRIAADMPLLFQHSHENVIGTLSSVVNTGREITNRGEIFSDIDDVAANIVNKAGRGVQYQQSIGLFDYEIEELKKGTIAGTIAVNGREFSAPIVLLKNGIIREISIVSIGADKNTNAAFFSEISKLTVPSMIAEIITSQSSTLDKSDLSAKIIELSAQISQITARAEAAEMKLAEEHAAARKEAVKALFKEFGKIPEEANLDI